VTLSAGKYKKRGVDLIQPGQVFGKWTVVERCPNGPNRHARYVCRCKCSRLRTVDYHHLLQGASIGCRGCSGRISPDHCKKGHDLRICGKDTRGQCGICRVEQYLRRNYGITKDDYKLMFEYQFGKCAICGINLSVPEAFSFLGELENSRRAEIDHRHVPKAAKPQPEKRTLVRGLLCGGRYAGCNARLGRVDDAEWLRAAAAYIEKPPAQAVFKTAAEQKKRQDEKNMEDD
jgi:Recombination endonuclease VII